MIKLISFYKGSRFRKTKIEIYEKTIKKAY